MTDDIKKISKEDYKKIMYIFHENMDDVIELMYQLEMNHQILIDDIKILLEKIIKENELMKNKKIDKIIKNFIFLNLMEDYFKDFIKGGYNEKLD